MKPTDFRIGNIVGFKNRTDCYCEIETISSMGGIHLIRHFEDGYVDDQPELIKDITGIKLDKVMAIRLGFKRRGEWFEKNGVGLIFEDQDCRMTFAVKRHGISYNQHPLPRFVHELQNAYYVFTWKELTIKQ
jgi:hypothetical protein